MGRSPNQKIKIFRITVYSGFLSSKFCGIAKFALDFHISALFFLLQVLLQSSANYPLVSYGQKL